MTDPYRILAIDPGPTFSAFVLLEGPAIKAYGKWANQDIRVMLLSAAHRGQIVIEEVRSYGMPVGIEVFDTVRWSGRFQEIAEARGIGVALLPRQKVKLHHCHSVKANDPAIRQAIVDRYGGDSVALDGKLCGRAKAKSHGAGCPICHGSGWERAPGPLAGISKDVWAALALGLAWMEGAR